MAPATAPTPNSTPPFRTVAYVASWSIPPIIHPEKLTDINFAFARIINGKVTLHDESAATSLKSIRALKNKSPSLKVLISIGGWTAEGFSDAALTDTSRATFAHSAVDLLREYDLDGIDIDWEYPGQGVAGIKSRPEDRQNFTLLLKALRHHLDAESATGGRRDPGSRRVPDHPASNHYLLTIAAADHEYFDHTEMDKLHVYLDWINMMTYDFFNSLTPTTGHHAGLYPSKLSAPNDRDANAAVKQYLAAGIPADKLVLGVAFYGRGFTGVTPVNHGLNQPYERFEAEHSYADLQANFIDKNGFVRYWDDQAKAPYLWNSTTRTFITYDDPESIKIKTRYAKEHHLGGIMFWELSEDHADELLDVIEPP